MTYVPLVQYRRCVVGDAGDEYRTLLQTRLKNIVGRMITCDLRVKIANHETCPLALCRTELTIAKR